MSRFGRTRFRGPTSGRRTTSGSLGLAERSPDGVDRAGVLDARKVSRVLAGGHRPDRTTDDLRAAGPRQLVDEDHPRRPERRPEMVDDDPGEIAGRHLDARSSHDEAPDRLTLHF